MGLIPSLKVEFIPKKIRGWLAPATFKARDSDERGQAALPYLYNSTCSGFPIKLLSSELLLPASNRGLIPGLNVEFIPKKIRGREGWLAPATFKARDSEERGQAALPYL